MPTVAILLSVVPVPALAYVALSDVACRRVPNWACGLVAACGLLLRAVSGDLILSLVVSAAVFAALYVCFWRGWLGGGDVKLLSACALLVPAHEVPTLILAVAMAGGVMAAFYCLGRSPRLQPALAAVPPSSMLRRVCRVEAWRIRRCLSLPYACAIVAGCVFTLVKG